MKTGDIKIKKSRLGLSVVFILLALAILLFTLNGGTKAVGEVSYCCEKTVKGAWCQSVNDVEECATGGGLNPAVATSCEATSYCKIGTCINRQEGTCNEAPQAACESNGGFWDEREINDIPQCQVGCCLIGDQASMVTQANCNRQSSLYGLDINFRADIIDQDTCLANAFSEEKGACVLDDGLQRRCELTTKRECQQREASAGSLSVEFHQGLLCSAESLETICGPSERTTCVEDKDEVYFLDACGNLANIYDASKVEDTNYWTYIVDKGDSCNPDSSNANSASCGNCDYLLGSTCKAYERESRQTTGPEKGDYFCADLSCEYEGDTYEHGETWCDTSPGFTDTLPGSESYRMICYNGEVTWESSSGRQKICVEEKITADFTSAYLTVNRWRDCVLQDNKADCEDEDVRDCSWLIGESVLGDEEGMHLALSEDESELIDPVDTGIERRISGLDNERGATCVPRYPPGFNFWEDENSTQCSIASDACLVKYEKSLLGGLDWDCKENCWCVDDDKVDGTWLEERRALCNSLGDCGTTKNWLGDDSGFDEEDDIIQRKCEPGEDGNFDISDCT